MRVGDGRDVVVHPGAGTFERAFVLQGVREGEVGVVLGGGGVGGRRKGEVRVAGMGRGQSRFDPSSCHAML